MSSKPNLAPISGAMMDVTHRNRAIFEAAKAALKKSLERGGEAAPEVSEPDPPRQKRQKPHKRHGGHAFAHRR